MSWLNYCRDGLIAVACVGLLVPGPTLVRAQQTPTTDTGAEAAAKLPPEKLDALVAPVALYPDSLLAQTLVASTYPLEIVQLQQWLTKNPGLKDKALADAVAKQPWDPSVQSMAAVPEVVKRLSDDIQWTAELGNAFLAQQSDVMDAVQRMRQKAKGKGALESNKQQKVETQTVGEKTVIVVESADPQVVYVPSYSPTVVYGAPYPYYPYPPIYYPPYPAGAAFVSFSFGVMMGAAWGGACCGMGWGGNDININRNNNFNQINHNGGRGGNGNGNGKWQHNPQHRGGAPYGDRGTADKFGGTARGDSLQSRQNRAQQQGGGGRSSGNVSTADRGSGRDSGVGGADRGSGRDSGVGGADRGSARDSGAGGADRSRSGGRDAGSKSGSGGGFGGGSGGFSGSSARASSSRGASSFGGGGRGGGGGGRRR